MSRKLLLQKGKDINKLADRLSKSDKVNSFDTRDREECGTLAHCFSDLEKSFSKFLDVYLPKLMEENIKSEKIENILFDIGLEFDHILYHIKDPVYFRHILTNADHAAK